MSRKFRSSKGYTEVIFYDMHLNPYGLNDFLSSVLKTGGSISGQPYSSETVIGLDIPLEGRNRTKRLYIHIKPNSVKLKYHPTKERRFMPYRHALETLCDIIEDGEMKPMKAEGTSYNNTMMPLIVDIWKK